MEKSIKFASPLLACLNISLVEMALPVFDIMAGPAEERLCQNFQIDYLETIYAVLPLASIIFISYK
jgi:hypothetical protein